MLYPKTVGELIASLGITETPKAHFQRRHYLRLAEAVKGLVAESALSLDDLIDVVRSLSEVLYLDNHRFDEIRFVEACGISWCLYTGEFFEKD